MKVKYILSIIIIALVIVIGRKIYQMYILNPYQENTTHTTSQQPTNTNIGMEVSRDHCIMMPNMPGCEIYDNIDTNTTETMNHADMVKDIETYLIEMVPHHQEAVESSKIYLSKTLGTGEQPNQLQIIAQSIIDEQAIEIKELQTWINQQYPTSSYVPHYMPMMRNTDTISDINILHTIYAEDMILHHQGAIDMSEKLLNILSQNSIHNNDFKKIAQEFAQNVILAQEKEIQEMNIILQQI